MNRVPETRLHIIHSTGTFIKYINDWTFSFLGLFLACILFFLKKPAETKFCESGWASISSRVLVVVVVLLLVAVVVYQVLAVLKQDRENVWKKMLLSRIVYVVFIMLYFYFQTTWHSGSHTHTHSHTHSRVTSSIPGLLKRSRHVSSSCRWLIIILLIILLNLTYLFVFSEVNLLNTHSLLTIIFSCISFYILFKVKNLKCKMTAGTKLQLCRRIPEESKLVTQFVFQAADGSFETLPLWCKERISISWSNKHADADQFRRYFAITHKLFSPAWLGPEMTLVHLVWSACTRVSMGFKEGAVEKNEVIST